jgi:hypothetical protein
MLNLFDVAIIQAVLKFIFVTGAIFYLVYSFIVLRQIQVMKKTLITSFSPSVNLLGFVNFFLAIALLVGFVLFL